MSSFRFILVLLLFVSRLACGLPLLTQQDTVQGVTMAVTPGALDEGNPVWEFAVAFHSSGPPLQDDLLQAAFLVAGGQRLQPLAWEGEGPTAAHHRAGILRFVALRSLPGDFEFHLERRGEATTRVLRWDFRGWFAMASPARN